MKKKSLLLSLILSSLFLYPIMMTFSNSLMTPEEIALNENQIVFIPQKISIRQYYLLFFERFEYLQMFWKSIFLTVPIVAGNSIYSVFMGSLLAKSKLKYKNAIFLLFVLAMFMPYQITMLPHYMIFKCLSVDGTAWAIILPMIFSPLGVVLITLFIRNIPDELIEAVKIDSSSLWDIFIHGIYPYAQGAIVILIIFTFAEAWNLVEQPLNVYNNLYEQPLSVLLAYMKYDPEIVFAASVIYIIPIIIAYFYFQESLEEQLQLIKDR